MRHTPSLDGLRAISISMVVIGHGASLHYESEVGGVYEFGCEDFFIISGYLIATLLLKEVRENFNHSAARVLCAAGVPDPSRGDCVYAAGVPDLLARVALVSQGCGCALCDQFR
jgi:hypothetical protein